MASPPLLRHRTGWGVDHGAYDDANIKHQVDRADAGIELHGSRDPADHTIRGDPDRPWVCGDWDREFLRSGQSKEKRTMTSIWDYPTAVVRSNRNVVGYEVVAMDGRVGKVDEASTVSGQAHLVVDTGFWIFEKKRLIPAGVVWSIDDDNEMVHIRLSKEELKSAPDYDPQHLDERDEYDSYYTRFGS
jgi:hypothetical protein